MQPVEVDSVFDLSNHLIVSIATVVVEAIAHVVAMVARMAMNLVERIVDRI